MQNDQVFNSTVTVLAISRLNRKVLLHFKAYKLQNKLF